MSQQRNDSLNLSRRDLLRAGGVLAGAGMLAACKEVTTAPPQQTGTGTSTGTGVTRPSIDEEAGDLKIYEWLGYGDGSYGDDALWKPYKQAGYPDPKFIKTFDDDSGYTKVAAGARYDVVHPCAYRFQDWVALTGSDGSPVMQPWDTSLIANFPDLNPALQTYGNIDGQQYFIVADWGFASPMYRADKIQPEESWGAIFDEQYAGRISWWDSLNMFIPAGLFLGIPEPYNMTDDELQQTTDFLMEKLPLVRTLWVDDPTPDLVNGDVDIAYAWQNHWWAALDYGSGSDKAVDAVYMNPSEGRISWYCGFALFNETQNYYHAHEYVNAWLSTQSAEWLINNYAYGHTNTALDLDTVVPELVEQFSLDDPSVLQEPTSYPERPYSRRDVYNDLWLEVKASAG
jgi:spermidine/putrescine transport system substrate-binding protein